MLYRGYHLEQKRMMVGWQITISKDDAFVRHSGISSEVEVVLVEARRYIDQLLSQITASRIE